MSARFLKATIRYLAPCNGKPVIHGCQRERDNLPLENRCVQIEDLRSGSDNSSLDREGFTLVQHRTAVRDFLDSKQVGKVYLVELAALLQDMTGATKVVPTTHVIRRSERSAGFCKDNTTVPGRFVHCDFSRNPAGSSLWVEKTLPAHEAQERLGRHFAIYNLWRVLSDPPQDTPLAICDARSVGPYDRVAVECVAELDHDPDLNFELSVFRYAANHRWCYFSNMTRDEVLVFKGFDSDPTRGDGIPHVAFDDPTCPPGAPPRENIDARFLAFFAE